MTLKELRQKLEAFPPYVEAGEGYIVDITKAWLDKYVELVKEVDEDEFLKIETSKEEVLQKLERVNKMILTGISLFLEGKFTEASNGIYDLFFNLKRSDRILIACLPESSEVYYRLRSCESNHLYFKREMFHIPFEARGYVENQRFSISGYPCLYFGKSVYGCWEELNRPNIDTLNMAAVKSVSPLALVNLVLPREINSVHILCRIPLDIACSLKVYHTDDYFKPQYIIPQLVLQCVLRRNQEGGIKLKGLPDRTIIDGIRYMSSHISDKQCLFTKKSLFINYVLPVRQVEKEGLCPQLCRQFKITEPSSVNIGKIYNEIPVPDEHADPYKKSLFGIMEEKLKVSTMENLEPVE